MQEQQPFVAGPAVVNHNSNIGHQILDDLDSIVVKQKADYIQNLGCQVENKYKVYAYQPSAQDQGFIGKKLFKCREHSTCCMRYCVAPSCREFQVGVYKTGQFKGPFLRFQRDYKATCFCLNRPELRVYHTENATEYNKKGVIQKSDSDVFLGTVRDPCDCCGIYFNIFNQNDILVFTIYGKCCQCGLCCRCPCSPCNKVVFDISDPKGEKVGEIQNVWAGCKKECCSTANNFIAHLPLKASWKEKSLLLGAILFIDFSYFEEKKKNNNNGGGGGY